MMVPLARPRRSKGMRSPTMVCTIEPSTPPKAPAAPRAAMQRPVAGRQAAGQGGHGEEGEHASSRRLRSKRSTKVAASRPVKAAEKV
jgi:hypothetical protein